jgi:hypothetical protein
MKAVYFDEIFAPKAKHDHNGGVDFFVPCK